MILSASLIFIWPFTIAVVMWVKSVVVLESSISGSINKSILSTIIPSLNFTAPNSIILSYRADNPVVSKSNTTYVALLSSIGEGLKMY